MSRLPLAIILLAASNSIGVAAPGRDAPPSTAEINDAISRSVDFRGTVVRAVLGCAPSGDEDGKQDPSHVEWYCAVDATPLPTGASHIEIALRRLQGPRKFDIVIGELAGVCPSASSMAKGLGPLVKTGGVTNLLTGKNTFAGSMVMSETDKAAALLECGYLGKIGRTTYQLTVHLTFDAAGYQIQGDGREERWNSDGKLIAPTK